MWILIVFTASGATATATCTDLEMCRQQLRGIIQTSELRSAVCHNVQGDTIDLLAEQRGVQRR